MSTYVAEQVFDNLGLCRDRRCLDGILKELVLLREGNRLLPSLVLAVDVCCDLAEENKVVLLETLGEVHGIVVVVAVDRVAQSLVVLLLNQQVVEGVVDLTLVLRLNVQKERLDQRNVVALREHADNTVDIDPWCERLQQVGQQRRLLIEVETQRAVVNLDIAGLDDDVLECLVLPSIGCALHHR